MDGSLNHLQHLGFTLLGDRLLRHHGGQDQRPKDLGSSNRYQPAIDIFLEPQRTRVLVMITGVERRLWIAALEINTDCRGIGECLIAIEEGWNFAERTNFFITLGWRERADLLVVVSDALFRHISPTFPNKGRYVHAQQFIRHENFST